VSLLRGIKPPDRPPWIINPGAYHGGILPVGHARNAKIARPPIDRLRDDVHFAQRNQTNSLIELNNSDRSGNTVEAAGFHREQGLK
jgi:hypothetical protein